jgi:hypothetical protein
MQEQESLRRLGWHVESVLGQLGGQPRGLSRQLVCVDVLLAPARVHDHEPDQPGSNDEPDDEQPPVELGVHRREV